MSQEKIFTLKKGTEVPVRFDGVTIPYTVPSSDAEIAKLLPVEADRVAVFNQAYSLNLQKDVKTESGKEGATVELLRAHAVGFKIDKVRTKGPGSGVPKVKAAQVGNILGDDFLAMLTLEQKVLYEARLAQLAAAQAKPTTKVEAPAAPHVETTATGGKEESVPAPAPTTGAKQKNKSPR